MATTRLSTKGQMVVPKSVRDALDWPPGAELDVTKGNDCFIVTRKQNVAIPRTTVDQVAGFLKYSGPPVSLEEMDRAIEEELQERWRRKFT